MTTLYDLYAENERLLIENKQLREVLAHCVSSLDHLMAFKGSRLEETQRAGHELNITRGREILG